MDVAELFKNIESIKESLKRLEARPLSASKEEVQNIKNTGIRLDSKEVASMLRGDIVKVIPNTEIVKEQINRAVEVIAVASEQSKQKQKDDFRFMLILNVFLLMLVLILGGFIWHYKSYQVDAYKYIYLEKRSQIEDLSKVRLVESLSYADSLGRSDFSNMQTFVDTTDVAKVLTLERIKKAQKGKKKKELVENKALNIPLLYKVIFGLVGVLLISIGYRLGR